MYTCLLGNKGIDADAIICDETSRMKFPMVREVIAPLLVRPNVILICLSTPLGPNNWYSKMFYSTEQEMEDNVFRFHFSPECRVCKMAGKERNECPHERDNVAPWNVAANEVRIRLILRDDDNMFAQEMLGISRSNEECVYLASWLERFERRPPVQITDAIFQNMQDRLVVYTFCDPNGGGITGGIASEMAFCSLVVLKDPQRREKDRIVIVGMASCPTTHDISIQHFTTKYWSGFHKHPLLAQAHHVLCVENNQAGGYASMIQTFSLQAGLNMELYNSTGVQDTARGTGKDGVHTSIGNKNAAVITSISDFAHGCVWWLHEFNIGSEKNNDDKERAKVLKKMVDQLGNVHKDQKRRGHSYTGKTPQSSDDIAFAFILLVYHVLVIVNNLTHKQALEELAERERLREELY
jgi:hypothetical protein